MIGMQPVVPDAPTAPQMPKPALHVRILTNRVMGQTANVSIIQLGLTFSFETSFGN